MKKTKKKYMALAAVALILSLLTAVSVTYSWIDDVKQVEFDNDNVAKNGAPLKSGVDINSDIVITKGENSINLGNILQNSDLMIDNYNYGTPENPDERAHTKYEDAHSPSWSDVNKKKGYFYESGDMHLSGCYSDGETFYFPRQGTNVSGYREGNKDDENVNYISFTARVSSPDANVDFWFKELPTIKDNKTKNDIAKARFAITVDGDHHVYSPDGYANTVDGGNPSPVSGVRKTSVYTYGNQEKTTTSRGANSNTLFSVKKGGTVNLNIKIWLETGFDANITASDINLQLISSWAYSREIHIVDRTTSNSKKSWLKDNSATMFFTCPSVLDEYAKKKFNTDNPDVGDWSGLPNLSGYRHAPFFQLTKDSALSTADYDVYKVTLPLVFNNEEMIIYRCSAEGWNSGDHSGQSGDYGVSYWNWWKSAIPNTYVTAIYTLYGGSHDNYAAAVVTDDTKINTFLGYGTWGAVEEISVNQEYNGVNWAPYDKNYNVYIRDYSDYATSGETYVHSMYWNSARNLWTAVIPQSSSLIQFLYTQNSVIKGCYGYNSYNNDNPQMRPEGSVRYHFTFKNDKGTNVNGMGYWKGANHIYIIADGNDFSNKTSLNAYLYYKYKHWDNGNASDAVFENAAFPGTPMSEISEKYQNTYKVFKSDELDASNGKNMYPDRSKSNDEDNGFKITVDTTVVFNTGENATQTDDLIIYPGCYYDPATDSWLGSLHGTGRPVSESGSEGETGGGTDEGGGSMDGYSQSTDFKFKIDGHEYEAKTNGTDYKVRVNLAKGDNWTTVLKGSVNFGNGRSGDRYNTRESMDIYLSNVYNNNFSLKANSAGTFIISFKWENDNTIKIINALLE